jgi:hypothetical protein
VTGGNLFTIGCNDPAIYFFSQVNVRVSFVKLCDFEASIEFIQASGFPGKLPKGASFINGLNTRVFQNGQSVDPLPAGAQITIEFLIPKDELNFSLAILFWDGSQWVEVPSHKTADGFLSATLDHGGMFILIKK